MSRSLLQAGAVTALTLALTLTAPSYAGVYRHHDPAGDMQETSSTCDQGTCTSDPSVSDAAHRNADITKLVARYHGRRLYVVLGMRAFGRSSAYTWVGHVPQTSASRGASSARATVRTTAGADTTYTSRIVDIAVSLPHTSTHVFMDAVHEPDGRLLVTGTNPALHKCRGVRGHLDRETTTVHLSMPRRCLAHAGRVRVGAFGSDDLEVGSSEPFSDKYWWDSALSPDSSAPYFSPWIHRN